MPSLTCFFIFWKAVVATSCSDANNSNETRQAYSSMGVLTVMGTEKLGKDDCKQGCKMKHFRVKTALRTLKISLLFASARILEFLSTFSPFISFGLDSRSLELLMMEINGLTRRMQNDNACLCVCRLSKSDKQNICFSFSFLTIKIRLMLTRMSAIAKLTSDIAIRILIIIFNFLWNKKFATKNLQLGQISNTFFDTLCLDILDSE